MAKVLNVSKIKLLGMTDDTGVSDIAETEPDGKDDGSGVELSSGNEQQESESESIPGLRCNNSSNSKNCKGCGRWPKIMEKMNANVIAPPMKIDDPIEAANSSVWSTLGIKNDTMRSIVGFSQDFYSNIKRSRTVDGGASMAALMANPAALSRSLNFHENI